MKVGFIGLGLMGYAMASRLASKGYKLIVYNRTRAKAESLAKEFDVEVASSPKEVGLHSDVVHIMVSDDYALMDVVLSNDGLVNGLNEGKIVIQHSTITPMTSLRIMNVIKAARSTYVEAPVLGSVSEAREGRLITYVSGDKDYTKLPTISELSRSVIYVGPVPKASALKLAINNIFLVLVTSIAESLALVSAYGIDCKEFLKIVRETTWMKPIIERYEDRGLNPKFPTRFKLGLAVKDLRYFANALQYLGIPANTSMGASNVYALAVKDGLSLNDYSNIMYYMCKLGKKFRG